MSQGYSHCSLDRLSWRIPRSDTGSVSALTTRPWIGVTLKLLPDWRHTVQHVTLTKGTRQGNNHKHQLFLNKYRTICGRHYVLIFHPMFERCDRRRHYLPLPSSVCAKSPIIWGLSHNSHLCRATNVVIIPPPTVKHMHNTNARTHAGTHAHTITTMAYYVCLDHGAFILR